MKICGLSAVVLCFPLLGVAFSTTLRKTQKENGQTSAYDFGAWRANQERFKDFYPRPASFDEFRKQRLYPVQETDSTELSTFLPETNIAFGFNLPFFGFRFANIYIHLNGYLSFSRGLMEYQFPLQFPLKPRIEQREDDPAIIAPWFSYQEIRREIPESGVYTRQIAINNESDDWLRERLIMDFKEGMIGAGDFKPTHALIVTWRNMTFRYRTQMEGETSRIKTNTYQVILATDELRTYCMFIYDNIEWITHADNYEGLKGFPAFVGFNGGNRTRAFELRPFSQNPRIQLLQHRGFTNNIPGRWMFQVDEEVWPGSCIDRDIDPNWREQNRLTFFPRYGNMLGGTMVNVTGPCMGHDRENARVLCRFDFFSEEAVYRNVNHATCVQPFIAHHGYVNLSVSVNNEPYYFVGKYYIQPAEMGKEEIVVRNHADISEYPTSMIINWNPELLSTNGKDKASLHLWGYRESGPGPEVYPTLTYLDTLEEGTITVGTGFYEFDPLKLQERRDDRKLDVQFGFLSINVTSPSREEPRSL